MNFWSKALVLLALLWPTSLSAQKIDFQTFDKYTVEHFFAGAGVEVAGKIIIPEVKPWKRVLVTTTIGVAWELGQGKIEVWDVVADVLGAITVEIIW